MFWQVEQKERPCSWDDASEEQKQIHAACVVLNCARRVISHFIMDPGWVLIGFRAVCKVFGLNVNTLNELQTTVLKTSAFQLEFHSSCVTECFLAVTVTKQMSCSYTGVQFVDIQIQPNWTDTIGWMWRFLNLSFTSFTSFMYPLHIYLFCGSIQLKIVTQFT